jgi:hypothetical protein
MHIPFEDDFLGGLTSFNEVVNLYQRSKMKIKYDSKDLKIVKDIGIFIEP